MALRPYPLAEQRRLEIARAMAGDPKLLLLDEPVAGLNIRETEVMGDLILQLKEQGQTIILVEHNMHLVMGISDWVIVLHHGSKIAEGRPEEIQKDPVSSRLIWANEYSPRRAQRTQRIFGLLKS